MECQSKNMWHHNREALPHGSNAHSVTFIPGRCTGIPLNILGVYHNKPANYRILVPNTVKRSENDNSPFLLVHWLSLSCSLSAPSVILGATCHSF